VASTTSPARLHPIMASTKAQGCTTPSAYTGWTHAHTRTHTRGVRRGTPAARDCGHTLNTHLHQGGIHTEGVHRGHPSHGQGGWQLAAVHAVPVRIRHHFTRGVAQGCGQAQGLHRLLHSQGVKGGASAGRQRGRAQQGLTSATHDAHIAASQKWRGPG
jgi:hypothetical protein